MCKRLWIQAKNAFRHTQESMTPLTLETILFLKVNFSYREQSAASKAMTEIYSAHASKRLFSKKQNEEIHNVSGTNVH